MVLLDEDLVLYLPFSEGAPDVATVAEVLDRSQSQNNGTVSGAILVKPYEDMSNDSDDEGDNPNVIYDDDETFWTLTNWGAGAFQWTLSEETTIVKKGSSSAKIQRSAGANSSFYIDHIYGALQDWSQYDYFTIWVYGANSAVGWWIRIDGNDGTWADHFAYQITDNFTGWRRFIIPLERFSIGAGAPDWSTVKTVRVFDSTGLGATYYFDRTTIDVGNWRFGEAADFDGTNDEIHFGVTAFNDLSDLTISFWIARGATSGDEVVFSLWKDATNRYTLFIDGTSKGLTSEIKSVAATQDVDSDVALVENVWTHAVLILGSDGLKMYINGVLQVDTDASTLSFSDIGVTTDVSLGALNGAAYFDGLVDEFRIYRRILSPEEVRMLYEQSSRRG